MKRRAVAVVARCDGRQDHGLLAQTPEGPTSPAATVRIVSMGEFAVVLPEKELAALARRWRIEELAVFGSVTRDDFGRDSDIDVLVTFERGSVWNLWDFIDLKEQLETLFGRPVDLVEKQALRNPYRRHHILSTAGLFMRPEDRVSGIWSATRFPR